MTEYDSTDTTADPQTDTNHSSTVSQTVMRRRTVLSGVAASLPFLSGCSIQIGSDSISQLNTYTNKNHGYNIQYPSEWTVKNKDPSEVIIEKTSTEEFEGKMAVYVNGVSKGMTVDTILQLFIRGMKKGDSTIKVTKKQPFTLESGQSAKIIDVMIDYPEGVVLGKLCSAIEGRTGYLAIVLLSEQDYDDNKKAATTIIESLTIE